MIYRQMNWLVALSLLFCSFGCLKQKEDTPPASGGGTVTPSRNFNWTEIADSANSSLGSFYNAGGNYYQASSNSGAWAGYWPTAHALDVLVDAYLRHASQAIKTQMDNLLTGLKVKNGNTWVNNYYDDMEWMALASLRAYQATKDVQYKDLTDILWTDIKNGWSDDLGGGLWWRKDNPSKNTPSNMPAAILAARLYALNNRAEDLQWAMRIYNWEKSVLYESGSGLVYDNIDKNGFKNTSWKFTYNQGTFLGAALELYKISANTMYLEDAFHAADYTLNGPLTVNGILKDEGGGDGGLFKGVFVRYFTRLIADGNIDQGRKLTYISFLKHNAETLWNKAGKSPVSFNTDWNKIPDASVDLTTQLSGIMLFEAMAELKKLNLL